MPLETLLFEPERYFQTEESRASLIENALESRDIAYLIDAIGIAVRAHGIEDVAAKTGVSCRALDIAFRPNKDPKFDTVMKVLNCLGLSLALKVAA